MKILICEVCRRSYAEPCCPNCGITNRVEVTHIALNFPSQHSTMLFRAESGICIGQQKNAVAVYGDQPNKRNSHVFIDDEHARRWLLEVWAKEDNDDKEPVIEDRAGEGMVTLVPDSIDFELAQNGPPRAFDRSIRKN